MTQDDKGEGRGLEWCEKNLIYKQPLKLLCPLENHFFSKIDSLWGTIKSLFCQKKIKSSSGSYFIDHHRNHSMWNLWIILEIWRNLPPPMYVWSFALVVFQWTCFFSVCVHMCNVAYIQGVSEEISLHIFVCRAMQSYHLCSFN